MPYFLTNVVIVENQCIVISVNHIQDSHDCMYTYLFVLYCVTQLFMMIFEYTMQHSAFAAKLSLFSWVRFLNQSNPMENYVISKHSASGNVLWAIPLKYKVVLADNYLILEE